jgi:arylsulfatase
MARPLRAALPCLLLALGGCGSPKAPPSHDGPIVLITIDALRADVIGALGGPAGLTPNLDALANEADWVGRAISSSSWTVPAMASLWTGLQPYRHQNWGGEAAVLREELETLPEALAGAGYTTLGFHANRWLDRPFGWAQGFQTFVPLREGKRAARELEALAPGKTFLWAHVLPPHAPYVRRDSFAAQVPADYREGLPDRLTPLDLEPWFDPARRLSDEERRRAWGLYLYNVAYADQRAGQLLKALRRGAQWDRSLVVVTSDHGEEFGEMGQVLHGGNLGRALLEVPLLVKWPKGRSRRLAPAGGPIATQRLWATLRDALGLAASADPAVAPSLLAPAEWPVLSELYGQNGTNQFSLRSGDRQLLWTSRFAPAEPDFYRARLASLGGAPQPPLREAAAAVFARLDAAFARTPPLGGGGGAAPALELRRWLEDGATAPIDDPAERDAMARRLRALWIERNGEDSPPRRDGGLPTGMTPEDREKLRALGYVAGDGG